MVRKELPRRFYLAILFFLAATIALPVNGVGYLAPVASALFNFSLQRELTIGTPVFIVKRVYVNGILVNTTTTQQGYEYMNVTLAFDGFVRVRGRGGLSAGNPLEISVTLFQEQQEATPDNITVTPDGAFSAVVQAVGPYLIPYTHVALGPYLIPYTSVAPLTNNEGVGLTARILLNHIQDRWTGSGLYIYNQGGTFGFNFAINNYYKDAPGIITVDPDAATVAAQTNSALLSVELAIVGFSVLEVKLGKLRQKAPDDYHDYQYDG